MAEHMLVFRNDFERRALERLVSQDANRPRVAAYVAALAAATRVVEAVVVSVFFGLDFELAIGVARDRWGKIVGELRGGLLEARFEAYQGFRTTVNTTDATVPRMLALLERMFGPKTCRAVTMFPNGVKFYVEGGVFVDDIERAHAAQLFRDYAPAGACWPVIEATVTPFTFDTPFDESEGTQISQLIFGGR